MATGKIHPDNDPIDGEGTVLGDYWYCQCLSPDCNLRFPAPEKFTEKCPICHSKAEKRVLCRTSVLPENKKSDTAAPISVLMDNLRSVYNVGSILRTADGAGFSHAFLCGITPTPDHPRLAKTSLTAELHTIWSFHRNGVDLVQQLKKRGTHIISLETNKSAVNFFQSTTAITEETVLVVGNEICGIDPAILDLSDQILYLPMGGIKKSLNVAVSFGIAAYSLIHRHPVKSE